MPELPEVETVVREIRPHLVGREIDSIRLSNKQLRTAWSSSWNKTIRGQRIKAVLRRGKWILLPLAGGGTLLIHLGMTGQLTVAPTTTPASDHTHLVLGLVGTNLELRFRDVRRFGTASFLSAKHGVEDFLDGIGLGPEPFDVEADYWRKQLGKTRRCLKAVLLDQRVVAGIGNIYADESCFAARLHPGRSGNDLSRPEIRRLAQAVPAVLKRAIDKRGSTIRDYVGGNGLLGGFQHEFCVYARTGQPCHRCGQLIRRVRLAGRSTHFCPRCQKA